MKAVGKSATALERVRSAFLLEDPVARQLVEADPGRIVTDEPVLIDEWHHLPETWDVVRRAVDSGAAPGQFLLTGSASALHPGTPGVSLAGSLTGQWPPIGGDTDVDLERCVGPIIRSGFPALRSMSDRLRRAQLATTVDRIVDEAAMGGTRDLHRIITSAHALGAKVILVGDHHQLPQITAGGEFAAAVTTLAEHVSELVANRRQIEPWEHTALDELRHGNPTAAYVAHGRVDIAATTTDMLRRIITGWWNDHHTGRDTVMLAGTRAQTRLGEQHQPLGASWTSRRRTPARLPRA